MRQRLWKMAAACAVIGCAAAVQAAQPADPPQPATPPIPSPAPALPPAQQAPADHAGITVVMSADLPAANSQLPIPPQIEGLIKDLHSPVFATRDAATTALMRLDPSYENLLKAAAEIETDDEAFTRLTRAALHLHLRARTPTTGQTGALGITLNIEPVKISEKAEPSAAIAVMGIEPGFPAEEVLKPGDRIVALGGQTFPVDMDVTAFRDRLNATAPGHLLHFTILRDGKLMKADVMLAGLSNETPLANLVDERRNNAENYVAGILASAAISRESPPLVIPDRTASDMRLQVVIPPGFVVPQAPQPDLIAPTDMLVPQPATDGPAN